MFELITKPLRRMYEYLFKGRGKQDSVESMEASSGEVLPGEVGPKMTPVKIVTEGVSTSGTAETAEQESPKESDRIEDPLESTPEREKQEPKTSTHSYPSGNHERWKITHHPRSPFEKVGSLYLSGENLVIRSELDRQGFSMRLVDVEEVLEGEVGIVYSIDGENQIGTAKLSVSKKGMNFTINPFFYTTPLASLVRVLSREVRKAPLFVGREQVEG
jgi:hypothetical protein